MKYTTAFSGSFRFSRELSAAEFAKIREFAGERHAGEEFPGCWCQWTAEEKFYEYISWLRYLIDHFYDPWGVQLTGEVKWEGEDGRDVGKIVMLPGNVIEVLEGVVRYVRKGTR
jgi:hypothetical protein